MMIPVIMNSSFEKIGLIDDYISFIWSTRYYACGDFELCVDVSVEHINMLQIGYYVMREDDENVGIIEKILLKKNEDNQELLIVSGRFLSSIIGRRIISSQTQINATVDKGIYSLLSNEIINPKDSERKVSDLIFKSLLSKTERINAQYTGKNLLTVIEELCLTYGIGFKTILDESNMFVFLLYEGIDRSYNQNLNPYVVFSNQYDNLISSEYEENHQVLVNAVLVAGEGEGIDRKMLWVTNNNEQGLDRYEYFADRRDLQSNDGQITESEYIDQMMSAGESKLTTYTSAFTGKVYFNNIVYRKDVYVGDICTIENEKWGIYVNSRLVEVIESVNEAGEYSIIPTFGI